MRLDRKKPGKGVRRAWNGGSPEAALEAAQRNTEQAIAAGAKRCPECGGNGILGPETLCGTCRGAGIVRGESR